MRFCYCVVLRRDVGEGEEWAKCRGRHLVVKQCHRLVVTGDSHIVVTLAGDSYLGTNTNI